MAGRLHLFCILGRVVISLLSVTPCVALSTATAGTQSFRVVILGSSTAVGAAANPIDSSWVNRYARYLATVFTSPEVVNLAIGGNTTFNVMPTGFTPPSPWNTTTYFPRTTGNITRALQLYPNLIIVNLPSNDCADHIPVERQTANYDRILQEADAAGVPIWVTTSQPRNLDQAGRTLLQQMRSAILGRYSSHAIDFWSGIADGGGSILPQFNADGTHLNNAGHRVLFGRVVDAIRFAPSLAAQPAEVDFGPVRFGVAKTLPVTLMNATASAIALDGIRAAQGLFSVDRSDAVVPSYGTVDLHVTFTPSSFWYSRDTLLMHSASGGSGLRVPLKGVSPVPTVQASPLYLNFDTVATHASNIRTLALGTSSVNDASVEQLSFSRAGFSVTPGSGVISASSPLTLRVTFAPEWFGSYSDTLRIRGGFTNGEVLIPVMGSSPAPTFALSPALIAFPQTTRGMAVRQRVQLQNRGANPLTVLSFSTRTRHYSVPTAAPAEVGAGDSLVFEIQFKPDTTGEIRDTIAVVTNGGSKEVAVAGTSPEPRLWTSTSLLEFGTAMTGSTLWRSVVLRLNQHGDTLGVHIDSVRVNGAGFAIDGARNPVTLMQADSVVLRVGFSPMRQMVYRDTLHIFNSTFFSNVEVPLRGTGSGSASAVGGPAEQPEQTMLMQNYPNPFNPSTTLRFRVGGEETGSGVSAAKTGSGVSGLGSSVVRLAVYDLLGREVAVLVSAQMEPGTYTVDFTAGSKGLPSGVYYSRLTVGQTSDVKPMLLVR